MSKSTGKLIKENVRLTFSLTQHSRDKTLITKIMEYLDCGNISKHRDSYEIRVIKFKDIETKLIPFFRKYPLIGNKLLDFNDFCKVAEIMMNKGHLNEEGLEQIRKIKSGMNTGRKRSP